MVSDCNTTPRGDFKMTLRVPLLNQLLWSVGGAEPTNEQADSCCS